MSHRTGIGVRFGYPEVGARKRFELIKSAGFDSVMILWQHDSAEKDYGTREEFAELSAEFGLGIEHLHAPLMPPDRFNDASASDSDVLAPFKECIDACSKLSVGVTVMHFVGETASDLPNKTALRRLSELVRQGEDQGVTVAIENIGCVAALDMAFEKIPSKSLGFCYDSGHEKAFTHLDGELLSRYRERLCMLHLSDNDESDDYHMLPFDGDIDWDKRRRQLISTGFDGTLMLEVVTRYYAPSKRTDIVTFLSNANAAARRLIY